MKARRLCRNSIRQYLKNISEANTDAVLVHINVILCYIEHTYGAGHINPESVDDNSRPYIPCYVETAHPTLIHILLEYICLVFVYLCSGAESDYRFRPG